MTTPAEPSVNEIVVEAVQYTPGRDPVIVQWSGKKAGGPLSGSRLFHTTQTALAGEPLDKTDLRTVQWTDDPVETSLVAHLAEHGISAVIVRDEAPSEKTDETPAADAVAATPVPRQA